MVDGPQLFSFASQTRLSITYSIVSSCAVSNYGLIEPGLSALGSTSSTSRLCFLSAAGIAALGNGWNCFFCLFFFLFLLYVTRMQYTRSGEFAVGTLLFRRAFVSGCNLFVGVRTRVRA